jgi:tetratricopeptide (TPR) repeat protein
MNRNRTVPRKKPFRPALILAALLAVALVVRVVFLIQLERSGFAGMLTLDSKLYYGVAQNISKGAALPANALTFNPLYPAFLIVVFKLFGQGLLAPRIVQLVLGLAMIVLIYIAGVRLAEGSRKERLPVEAAALIAAAMAVLYAQFVLYEGMLLASTLEIFLFTASFVVALSLDADLHGERPMRLAGRRIPAWAMALLLGALCGAGALARPNLFLLLAAALPVWLYVRGRRTRRALIPAAACIVGAALFLAPPIVFNAKTSGRMVPVTAQGGFNFYMGNGPGSTGIFRPPEDVRGNVTGVIEDSRAKAEAETGRTMTPAEASEYYMDKTLSHIRSHPGTWLRLLGRKLLILLSHDVPDMPDAYFYERSSPVLGLLFMPFSIIAALGACGFVVLLLSGRNRSVTTLFLGVAVASVLLFFVNVRYRLLLVPLMILLAAFSIAWAAREISRGRLKRIAIMVAAALAIFFLVSSRTFVPMSRSASYAFLGNYYIEQRDEAKAAEAFAEAYRLDPNKIEAMINYARILRQQGRNQESADMFARAYARSPRYPILAIEYGMALRRIGRRDEAKKLFFGATSVGQPQERALACRLLAQEAITDGNRSEAILWVKRALENVPGEPQLTAMLKELEGSP